jgi:hypothetical protein
MAVSLRLGGAAHRHRRVARRPAWPKPRHRRGRAARRGEGPHSASCSLAVRERPRGAPRSSIRGSRCRSCCATRSTPRRALRSSRCPSPHRFRQRGLDHSGPITPDALAGAWGGPVRACEARGLRAPTTST